MTDTLLAKRCGRESVLTQRSQWTGFHSERCRPCSLGTPSGSPLPPPYYNCKRTRGGKRKEKQKSECLKLFKLMCQTTSYLRLDSRICHQEIHLYGDFVIFLRFLTHLLVVCSFLFGASESVPVGC